MKIFQLILPFEELFNEIGVGQVFWKLFCPFCWYNALNVLPVVDQTKLGNTSFTNECFFAILGKVYFAASFFFFTVLALPTFWRIWPSVSRNIDTLGGLRDEPPAQSVYLSISFFFLSVPRFFDQDVITDNSFAFQHIFVDFIHLSAQSCWSIIC